MASQQINQETHQQQVEWSEELNNNREDPNLSGELEEHPEGSKRGGYVRVHYKNATIRAYYDSTAGQWFPYDEAPPQ